MDWLNDLIEPMLATLVDEIPTGDYAYEVKWDGVRAIIVLNEGQIRIQSRNNNDITHSSKSYEICDGCYQVGKSINSYKGSSPPVPPENLNRNDKNRMTGNDYRMNWAAGVALGCGILAGLFIKNSLVIPVILIIFIIIFYSFQVADFNKR